jgi:hypothetical protein
MSREVMQQALDALEKFGRGESSEIPVTLLVHNLRAELAKPDQYRRKNGKTTLRQIATPSAPHPAPE